ncbi:MAG: hypothetical protein AAGK05_15655, partial [Pseudomonadota bacterium]
MNKISPALTSTFDRENMSNRQASSTYVAVAESLGHDVSELSVSASTIHRMRRKHRSTIAESFSNFVSNSPSSLVLHWDGKLLPNPNSNSLLEDRIAVIVTGEDFEEILGIPISVDGTGREVARVVLNLVQEHQIEHKIIGLCFDTFSNTGLTKGACSMIEQAIQRPLFWLACRHHILEIILRDVFTLCCGKSNGPDIPFFKRFQQQWSSIQKDNFTTMADDDNSPVEESSRLSMIEFLKNAINQKSHPREDYLELLQLSLVFLGGIRGEDTQFRAPGACHHARWMAKAIYAIKMTLFADQFQLRDSERKGLRRLASFVCLLYVRFWHE